MPKRSFTAVFRAVDPEPGFDGICALQNVSDLDHVHVTDVRVAFAAPYGSDATNTAGNGGVLSLDRITGYSGGATLSPVSMDTNATATGWTIKASPDSVTESGGQIRRFGDVKSYGIAQSISFQAQLRAPGVCDINDHSGRTAESHDVWHADGIASTEPIVLRPGEGLACIRRAYGVAVSLQWGLVVIDASHTYTCVFEAAPKYPYGPAWSVYNEQGSGINIGVMVIRMPDFGESNMPRFRLARIESIIAKAFTPAEAPTLAKHDTQSDLSSIALVGAPFRYTLAGGLDDSISNYSGSPVPIAAAQRVGTFRQFMVGHTTTETATPNMHGGALGYASSEHEVWPGERRFTSWDGDEIVLRPGQSLALIGGGNGTVETSEAAHLDVEIVGYIETSPTRRATFALGG